MGSILSICLAGSILYLGLKSLSLTKTQKQYAWLTKNGVQNSLPACVEAIDTPDEVDIDGQVIQTIAAPYQTYIVRCWQTGIEENGQLILRFTLDVPATGQRFGFTSLEALTEALGKVKMSSSQIEKLVAH